MSPRDIAALSNVFGFLIGGLLYTMLLAMVLRNRGRPLFATALLGLYWNVGALVIYGFRDLALTDPPALFSASAFSALGFLPAVVVDSVLWSSSGRRRTRTSYLINFAAYGLSVVAAVLQFSSALSTGTSPSVLGFRTLTFGFAILILVLVLATRQQTGWGRAIWAVALAVFAVSALHLSQHRGSESWWIELAGHHASIPLALAILYQDYRFAFADLFLKRAIALVALALLAFGLYLTIAAPLLAGHPVVNPFSLRTIGVVLSLWIGTALAFPYLTRAANWFVDKVVLRRADYDRLRSELTAAIARLDRPEEILDSACQMLKKALTASNVTWRQLDTSEELHSRTFHEQSSMMEIPVTERPGLVFELGPLSGGRRLLSDDLAMLDAVSFQVARRIDALRVTNERYEHTLKEQQISKLAAEAELKALRTQLNPHFLFNALTTIGYLIQTSPERALHTLMRLTELLRGVLKRSHGEFTSLGEELDLVESYLAIEKARFEERLRISIDVPGQLRVVRIPPLILQPLVENAIKHGISRQREGGEVAIRATLDLGESLKVFIEDSGAGADPVDLVRGRNEGVGISNVEKRLAGYYGDRASLEIDSKRGKGTHVAITIPTLSSSETVQETSVPALIDQ